MRKIIYFILAGLTIAGLASCEKQELKPSVSDIYSVEIEEDSLQTKAESNDIEIGGEKTFYATLKKSSDGGKTYSYVSHSNWQWIPPTNCSIKSNSQNNNDTKYGVTAGSVVIVGNSINTANLTVTAKSAPTGDISKNVAVTVTDKPKTVTFNFNPDIESLVLREFPASQTQKYITASQAITIWEPDGTYKGNQALVDFFSYTGWTLTEVKSQFNQSTKDTRVKSYSTSTKSNEIYVGIGKGVNSGSYVQCHQKDENGITFIKAYEPNVKLSSGSSASPSKYPSGYTSNDFKAVYKLTVNSDMSVTVTIGD